MLKQSTTRCKITWHTAPFLGVRTMVSYHYGRCHQYWKWVKHQVQHWKGGREEEAGNSARLFAGIGLKEEGVPCTHSVSTILQPVPAIFVFVSLISRFEILWFTKLKRYSRVFGLVWVEFFVDLVLCCFRWSLQFICIVGQQTIEHTQSNKHCL